MAEMTIHELCSRVHYGIREFRLQGLTDDSKIIVTVNSADLTALRKESLDRLADLNDRHYYNTPSPGEKWEVDRVFGLAVVGSMLVKPGQIKMSYETEV